MLSRVWFWMHWILPKHTNSSQLRILKVDSFRSYHKNSIDNLSFTHSIPGFFFKRIWQQFPEKFQEKVFWWDPAAVLEEIFPVLPGPKKNSQAPLGDLQEPCNLLIWGFSCTPYMRSQKNIRQRGFHLFKAEKTWLENWKNHPMIQCESGRDVWRNHFYEINKSLNNMLNLLHNI